MINALDVGLAQCAEGPNGLHHQSDVVQTVAEAFELAKDVHLRDLQCLTLQYLLALGLGLHEALLVSTVQVLAGCYTLQQKCGRQVPYFDGTVIGDVSLAGDHHLIGHLHIKTTNRVVIQ